jgi:hypothetical protein
MALTFLCPQFCRLCEGEFEATEGEHAMEIGGVRITLRARRYIMPQVCDECWADFEEWRRKTMARRRKEGDANDRTVVQAEIRSVAIESVYGKYRETLLAEWLAAGLENEADFTNRKRRGAVRFATVVHGIKVVANHIQERRAKQNERRRRWFLDDSRAQQRMAARYIPFKMPHHAAIEACK